jgi:Ran GTPase-activating protein (RanGAP) involved in mRNA processing and transport
MAAATAGHVGVIQLLLRAAPQKTVVLSDVLAAAARGQADCSKLLASHVETLEATHMQAELQNVVGVLPYAERLRHVDLESCGTEEKSSSLLAQVCTSLSTAEEPSVKSVQLRGCFENAESALVAAGALGRLAATQVREIRLQLCCLDARGARALVAAAAGSRCLRALDLRRNQIGSDVIHDFAAAFCDSSLRDLVLHECGLTDQAAAPLAELAARLRSLGLSHNRLTDATASPLAAVLAAGGLDELDLSDTQITSSGAQALAASICKRDKVVVRLSCSSDLPQAVAAKLARQVDAGGKDCELVFLE